MSGRAWRTLLIAWWPATWCRITRRIAEIRCRHEHALSEVFSGVLGLCARVGLASVGVVSIDGTKMSANASMNANRDYTQ